MESTRHAHACFVLLFRPHPHHATSPFSLALLATSPRPLRYRPFLVSSLVWGQSPGGGCGFIGACVRGMCAGEVRVHARREAGGGRRAEIGLLGIIEKN